MEPLVTWDSTPEGWRLIYGATAPFPFSVTLLGRGPLQDAAVGVPGASWKRLSEGGDRLVAPHQVHGTAVLSGRSIWSLPCRPKADGVLLDKPDIWGSLRFADCFPVVIGGFSPRPWLLLLHSGYQGTVRGIIPQGMALVRKKWGVHALDRSIAWVGPGIEACCYVRKVHDPATKRGCDVLAGDEWSREEDLVRFDLAKALRRQLIENGLAPEKICHIASCTSDTTEKLYSYRQGDLFARNFLYASVLRGVH